MVNILGLLSTVAIFTAIVFVVNKFIFSKSFDLTETIVNMIIVVVGLIVAGMVASKLPSPVKGQKLVSLK